MGIMQKTYELKIGKTTKIHEIISVTEWFAVKQFLFYNEVRLLKNLWN